MATVIDAKEWVFEQLVNAVNANKISISGHIYIDKKPDEDKENIVVNSITGNDEFFQAFLLNVNCYVPNLSVNTGSKTISMPDRPRLKQIASDVYKVLKDHTKNQVYRSFIEDHVQEEEETENAHFINFRMRLNAINY